MNYILERGEYDKHVDFKSCTNYREIASRIKVMTQSAITCSKLTIETLERGMKYVQSCLSGVFIVNFKYISHLILVFLLLTLSR